MQREMILYYFFPEDIYFYKWIMLMERSGVTSYKNVAYVFYLNLRPTKILSNIRDENTSHLNFDYIDILVSSIRKKQFWPVHVISKLLT